MMNIVKQSRKSNSPSLPKKQFFLGKNNVALIATVLLATLLGTYLDLLLVHSGFYTFPKRLFPKLFSINILFTLVILPIITTSFLMVMSKIHPFVRPLLLCMIGIFAYLFELMAERIGLFIHAPKWNHLNSFIGYILFFMMMWRFYSLLVNSTKNK